MIIIMQGEMRFIIFSSYHSERRHHNFSLIAALIEIINDQQKRKKKHIPSDFNVDCVAEKYVHKY